MTTIFTRAKLPDGLEHRWLQHLRDFDVNNPGCHFEVMVDVADAKPLAEIMEMMKITPGFSFSQFFKRAKP